MNDDDRHFLASDFQRAQTEPPEIEAPMLVVSDDDGNFVDVFFGPDIETYLQRLTALP